MTKIEKGGGRVQDDQDKEGSKWARERGGGRVQDEQDREGEKFHNEV